VHALCIFLHFIAENLKQKHNLKELENRHVNLQRYVHYQFIPLHYVINYHMKAVNIVFFFQTDVFSHLTLKFLCFCNTN